ncbi:perilipin-2-like isoform X1 [Siniperca chuatsi]|uniref:perilipin-2-like isoform X1 n=1 Tax=Siniperca chuatsi TaxID=119488 RepID=UPI001CE11D3C|nr:perilipin-2-like isoform X1 [Siniperca chuatsi]XP_044045144.1 perilipin-2-like isoform X1 [Siniperca chuatsi]XP_044045145.1 perilipin-2-like isoform X1 [Siniperca chuatsi]UVT37313.1 perilipin 2 [Siniperca chuatsi]
MPMNNNQKVQTAAARLAKLPVVRSACIKLSVLYIDTKCSHPNLRSVCEVLESSATAIGTAVIVKLEPQLSIANDVACKSLDWLETAFPVLHKPTEQIVATAKNKMHEIQDVVSIAANGTMDCVQHTVTWLKGRIQQVDDQADQSLVERTISVASVGLDSALIVSEALMDRVLPPTEEDKEEEAHLLEGFEAATLSSYPVRLVSLAAKFCRRTYRMVGSKMQSVQIMENLSRSPGLVQDLQTSWLTLAWRIQGLPHYVQHQLMSVFLFTSQMYNLSCPKSQQQSNKDKSCVNTAETSTQKDVVQVYQQATPTCRKRPLKMPVFDRGCNVKGCVNDR